MRNPLYRRYVAFSDRMKESLDWDYVRKELEKIELAQFERCMCDLVSCLV